MSKEKEVSPEVLAMLAKKGLKPKEGTEQPKQPESLITSEDIKNYINKQKNK